MANINPLLITPFFSLNSHSTTTKCSLQYLVPYLNIFHPFSLKEIVMCGEMKISHLSCICHACRDQKVPVGRRTGCRDSSVATVITLAYKYFLMGGSSRSFLTFSVALSILFSRAETFLLAVCVSSSSFLFSVCSSGLVRRPLRRDTQHRTLSMHANSPTFARSS
jgi:hypothetical protein